MQINYKTGRNYGTEQVLQITVEQDIQADYAMREIVATFIDSSRRISGRVHTTLFGSDGIGESILREYDAGRYTTI